jgi:hypothetical protein
MTFSPTSNLRSFLPKLQKGQNMSGGFHVLQPRLKRSNGTRRLPASTEAGQIEPEDFFRQLSTVLELNVRHGEPLAQADDPDPDRGMQARPVKS